MPNIQPRASHISWGLGELTVFVIPCLVFIEIKLVGRVLRPALPKTFSESMGAIARIGQNNAALIRSSYRQHHYGERLFDLYTRLLDNRYSQL